MLFLCFVILRVLFLFLGASIVCVNNLKRAADLVLWFLDNTSVCTHSWHRNDLIVLTVLLYLNKLKLILIPINSKPNNDRRDTGLIGIEIRRNCEPKYKMILTFFFSFIIHYTIYRLKRSYFHIRFRSGKTVLFISFLSTILSCLSVYFIFDYPCQQLLAMFPCGFPLV